MDLMFDVQVMGRTSAGDSDAVASIAAYYRRVTTDARPMNRVVATAMVLTLAAVIVEVVRGDGPAWVGWTSLALVVAAVTLAAAARCPTPSALAPARTRCPNSGPWP